MLLKVLHSRGSVRFARSSLPRLSQRQLGAGAQSVTNASVVCNGFDLANPLQTVAVSKSTIGFNPNDSEFADKVLLKTRAACIQPADINVLQGVYGTLPKTPFVPGGEGLFEIVGRGKDVADARYELGDLAVPSGKQYIGSWQQYIVADAKWVSPLKVSASEMQESLTLFQLLQLSVNPSTAYRILHDFVELQPLEYIVQNAANSAVGESTIQIARKMGLRTINIVRGSEEGCEVRSAEEFSKLKEHLQSLGGDVVVGSDDLAKMNGKERAALYGGDSAMKPRLALNSVGGRITMLTGKLLAAGGQMITFGGLSKKPFSVGAGALIFQDHSFKGFWLSRWRQQQPTEKYEQMLAELKQMALNGEVKLKSHVTKFGANGEGFDCALRYALGEDLLADDCQKYVVTPNDAKEAFSGDITCISDRIGKSVIHFDNDWLKKL